VNEPVTDPTLVPWQYIAESSWPVAIAALLPAADRLPPTVAFEVVPLPVGSPPLLPGPAAKTEDGARRAVVVIAATTSHESRLPSVDRLCWKDVCIVGSPSFLRRNASIE
jgi:hypothetical protein